MTEPETTLPQPGDLLESLPAPLSDGQLAARYGHLLEAVTGISAGWRERRLLSDLAARGVNLVLHAAVRAGGMQATAFQGVRLLGAVIRNWDAITGYVAALAPLTRGETATPENRSLAFEKPGAGCGLAGRALLWDSKLNLRLSLLDDQGKPLHPFTLSVTDEAGRRLLDNRLFPRGDALLNDLQPGTYRVRAAAGDRACELTVHVESAAS